jgi:hypothetical protein
MNKEILYDSPSIVLCHDLLTPEECLGIIDTVPLCEYTRAVGFNEKTRDSLVTDYRSNSTYIDNSFRLALVQQRLTKFIESEMEGNSVYKKGCIETPLQLQRYAVGQQYKAHIDFFNGPGQPKSFDVDRIASVILYLNDDFEGGETFFTALNIDVKPKAGMALFFKYDYNEMLYNMNTFHAGMPVSDGVKYIITTFIRSEPLSYKWNVIEKSKV